MKNKTVLITGGTSGIGYETALGLARMGACVVFTTRDEQRGASVCRKISEISGNPMVFHHYCRLDDFSSIRKFAIGFTHQFPVLDVLINNAGIWETSRKVSVDGIELTFAVNHLAPFLLTHLLLPVLRKSPSARIINTTSKAYCNARIHFEDPELKQSFPWMEAYRQSKLANQLFTVSLAGKLSGEKITVNCLHPGMVLTPIFRNMSPLLRFFFKFYMVSPARGAQCGIYLASSPEVQDVTGGYFIRKKQQEILPQGKDPETAQKLWALSLNYVAPWLPGNPGTNSNVT